MTFDPPRRYHWLLVAFVVTVLLYFARHPMQLATTIGVNHYGVWFLDLFAILASNDALARGMEIYAYNPLDYFGRPHVYPHWWLLLGRMGLTRSDAFWLGALVVAVFGIAALARLRPRDPGELLWSLCVFCSPPLLLALDRANNDLVVFAVLAPVVPLLLARRAVLRYAAIGLIVMATALKTYPAVAALVLLAGEDVREVRIRLGVLLVLFVVLGIDIAHDLAHYGGIVPRPDGLMTFGAAQVFLLLGASVRQANLLAWLTGAAVVLWLWRRNVLAGWTISPESRDAWWSFVLGAALLAGCFFAGLNFGYRWVFALWLVPLLWQTARDRAGPAPARRLARGLIGLLTLLLWVDGLASAVLTRHARAMGGEAVIRWADGIFLVEQPFVWAFFAALLPFLVHFARIELHRVWPGAVADR